MKLLLRVAGAFGLLLFASALLMTFLSPIHFEGAGKEFIRRQVESKVRDKIEDIQPPQSLERVSKLLITKYEGEIGEIKDRLEAGLPEKVAAVIAEMQDLNCDCRDKLGKRIRQTFEWRIASLRDAQSQLLALIQDKYVDIVQKLLLDLRIYSGSNAAMFAILLVVSFLRPCAIAQLFLPATVLLVATLVSAYFYLFRQNWFFTILYNDYVGYAYLVYLLLVFIFLCDVVLNRAKVTARLLDSLLQVLGSYQPC